MLHNVVPRGFVVPLMRDGEVELTIGEGPAQERIIASRVSAEMRMSPRPRVLVKLPAVPFDVGQRAFLAANRSFRVLPNGASVEALLQSLHSGVENTALALVPRKSLVTTLGSDTTQLRRVRFHVLNFYSLQTDRSVELSAGDWRVKIDPVESQEEVVKTLHAESGYGITHVGALARGNGGHFSAAEAKVMLAKLYWFLSFARGARCGVAGVAGFDANDNEVWAQWGSYNTHQWECLFSCLAFPPDGGWTLPEAFDGLLNELEDLKPCENMQRDPLRYVLHWYFTAHEAEYGTTRLPLCQAALERLAEATLKRLVENDVLKRAQTQNLNAGRRIALAVRTACGKSSAITEIPPSCSEMDDLAAELARKLVEERTRKLAHIPAEARAAELAKLPTKLDGPQTIAHIRNQLVHGSDEEFGFRTLDQAGDLALWYIELLLLWLIDYKGEYYNRIASLHGGDRKLEPVPWAKACCPNRP